MVVLHSITQMRYDLYDDFHTMSFKILQEEGYETIPKVFRLLFYFVLFFDDVRRMRKGI